MNTGIVFVEAPIPIADIDTLTIAILANGFENPSVYSWFGVK